MNNGNGHNGVSDGRVGRLLAMAAGLGPAEGPCPTPEQIAALMDGGLAGPERDRVLSHIAACGDCRKVLETAVRLADSMQKSSAPVHRGLAWLAPYAVAAVLAIAVVSAAVIYRSNTTRELPATNAVVAKVDTAKQAPEALKESAQSNPTPVTQKKEAPKKKAEVPPRSVKGLQLAMTDLPAGSGGAAQNEPERHLAPAAENALQTAPPSPVKPPDEPMGFSSLPPAERRAAAPYEAAPTPPGLAAPSGPTCKPSAEGATGVCELPEEGKETVAEATHGPAASAEGLLSASKQIEAPSAQAKRVQAQAMSGSASATGKEPDVVKATGTILSIDFEKLELVLEPRGTKDRITLRADSVLMKGLKTGDTIKTVYEKGAVNVARIISKQRTIMIPAGC